MAGPKKSKISNNVQAGDNTDDQEEGSDPEENFEGMEINATFDGRNIEPGDFEGIKQLLNKPFMNCHIDLAELTDIMISQGPLGCVIKQSSESDTEDLEESDDGFVFGVSTIINLTQHAARKCVEQLYAIVENKCKENSDNETYTEIRNIMATNRVGLLINERINMGCGPPLRQLAHQTLSALRNDIKVLGKKSNAFDLEYYFLVCCIYKDKDDGSNIIYLKEEDELFSKESDYKFQFSISDKKASSSNDAADEFQEYREVLLFQSNKIDKAVDKLQSLLQN